MANVKRRPGRNTRRRPAVSGASGRDEATGIAVGTNCSSDLAAHGHSSRVIARGMWLPAATASQGESGPIGARTAHIYPTTGSDWEIRRRGWVTASTDAAAGAALYEFPVGCVLPTGSMQDAGVMYVAVSLWLVRFGGQIALQRPCNRRLDE